VRERLRGGAQQLAAEIQASDGIVGIQDICGLVYRDLKPKLNRPALVAGDVIALFSCVESWTRETPRLFGLGKPQSNWRSSSCSQ
jgi:hypothetical protein